MKLPFAPVLLSALCACSSGSAPSTPALRADASITVENALAASRAAVDATVDVVRVAQIGARFLTEQPPEPPTGTAAAELSLTFDGPNGGQAIHTWNDADGDGKPSTGDTFTETFVAWSDGYELSGTVLFDEMVVTGDPFDGITWRIEARLHFVNLVVTQNAATTTWNGSVLCTREQRLTAKLLVLQFDSDFRLGALTLAAGARLERNEYPIDFTMGIFVQGFVTVPELGGGLEVATVAPLSGLAALQNPWAGTLEVRGGDRGVLQVVPVDFFNVEIHVDADGDGIEDALLPAEWAEL